VIVGKHPIGTSLLLAVLLSLGSGCLAGGNDVEGYDETPFAEDEQALDGDALALGDGQALGEEIDLGVALAELEDQYQRHQGDSAFAMADATSDGGDGAGDDTDRRSNPEPTPWEPGSEQDNPEPTPWHGEEGTRSDNPEPTPWRGDNEDDGDDDPDLDGFAQQASATTTINWDFGWD
jgi:hypothetical protein